MWSFWGPFTHKKNIIIIPNAKNGIFQEREHSDWLTDWLTKDAGCIYLWHWRLRTQRVKRMSRQCRGDRPRTEHTCVTCRCPNQRSALDFWVRAVSSRAGLCAWPNVWKKKKSTGAPGALEKWRNDSASTHKNCDIHRCTSALEKWRNDSASTHKNCRIHRCT